MTLVGECLKEIDAIRQQFRGQPEEFRPRYRRLTEAMMRRFLEMSDQERHSFFEELTREDSGLLFGISRSAATASIVEGNSERLQWGLLALIMENQKHDYRETLMELTLLDHSAQKLQVELETVFDPFKAYASEATSDLFQSYFREGVRQLGAMGYVEAKDKNGRFTYERTW